MNDVQPDSAEIQIAHLERELARARATCRELEQMLEDKARDLYTSLDQARQQTRALRQQTALGILALHESFDAAWEQILVWLCENLGWQTAALWRPDRRAGLLRCDQVQIGPEVLAPKFVAETRATTFPAGVGLPGRTWKEGAAAWIPDVSHDRDVPRNAVAAAEGLRAACAFPVRVHGEVAAVVELFTSGARDADAEVLETLDGIGIQLGRAIERRVEQQDGRVRDLALARRLQTILQPRTFEVEGFDVVASMTPAEEVGGDYYDVVPVTGGCWVGIGDVAGHGLKAGLVMLMVQAGVASLVRGLPHAPPSEHVASVNRMLFENIRRRLLSDEFVTFMLAHADASGKVTLAGAHEDVIVARAAGGPCEIARGRGTWLGAIPEVGPMTTDLLVTLDPGDLLVFYTDGLTEAQDAEGQFFGIDRLKELVSGLRARPTAEVHHEIVTALVAWTHAQIDDHTLVVMRRRAPAG